MPEDWPHKAQAVKDGDMFTAERDTPPRREYRAGAVRYESGDMWIADSNRNGYETCFFPHERVCITSRRL